MNGTLSAPAKFREACVRCSLLRPDPAQRARLEEIRDNLESRIIEAKREGWLGEVEGLQVSYSGVKDKLAQIEANGSPEHGDRTRHAIVRVILRKIFGGAMTGAMDKLAQIDTSTRRDVNLGTSFITNEFMTTMNGPTSATAKIREDQLVEVTLRASRPDPRR